MTKLENITKGTYLNGVIPNQMVDVIDAVWHGTDVANAGQIDHRWPV